MTEPAATTLTAVEIRRLERSSARWLADARARLLDRERGVVRTEGDSDD